MRNLKKDWWKVLILIISFAFINMILHRLLSPLNSSNISILKPSFFVKNGLLVPAIIIWELLTFSIYTLIFIKIQNNLSGRGYIKGIKYGFCIGGLYFIGMFESVLLFKSSVINEFLMGFTDFLSIVLMGLLLGIFLGNDNSHNKERQDYLATLVIAIFCIIGRYFAYSIFHIQSAYITKPLGTMSWTICLGIWIGVIYNILQSSVRGKSILSQALFFGLLILGSNWLMNHLFIAIIAEFSQDLLIRSGTDILFSILGVYSYKKFFKFRSIFKISC